MIKNPKTINDFIVKYDFKSDNLQDMLVELEEYSDKNNWSSKTFEKRRNKLEKLFDEYLLQLNTWLNEFGHKEISSITEARKVFKKKIFASIGDIIDKKYINKKDLKSLRKYLKKPGKLVHREYAKEFGYKVFLKNFKI
jgi:hypothetical protein